MDAVSIAHITQSALRIPSRSRLHDEIKQENPNGGIIMIYQCDTTYCRFTFLGLGQVSRCPDCGRSLVRPATAAEIEDYQRNHPDVIALRFQKSA